MCCRPDVSTCIIAIVYILFTFVYIVYILLFTFHFYCYLYLYSFERFESLFSLYFEGVVWCCTAFFHCSRFIFNDLENNLVKILDKS